MPKRAEEWPPPPTDKHTPEPWTHRPTTPQSTAIIEGYNGEQVVKVTDYVTETDARRIVACVNACMGVPTESLEAFGARCMEGGGPLEILNSLTDDLERWVQAARGEIELWTK